METSKEHTLEHMLQLAAAEPAHRPEFFRLLLDSNVYVLGSAGGGGGTLNLEAGSAIPIQHWTKHDGTTAVPFFSSLETLQKSVDSVQRYLLLPVRSLFEITLGMNLVLNPKSPYGKEFAPEEIKHLLSIGLEQQAVPRVVEENTQVLLGQPANYPSRMVDSLSQLLVKHSNVKRAYLALMHDPSIDTGPHLIVGLEADGDPARAIREAGNVIADTAPDGEPVDICHVSRKEGGLSAYLMQQTKPFYERSWTVKLRSLFKQRQSAT